MVTEESLLAPLSPSSQFNPSQAKPSQTHTNSPKTLRGEDDNPEQILAELCFQKLCDNFFKTSLVLNLLFYYFFLHIFISLLFPGGGHRLGEETREEEEEQEAKLPAVRQLAHWTQ